METDPHTLDITRLRDGGLALSGELDYATAPELTATVAALPLLHGDTLTLDLGQLAFCDSSGLSALLTAYKRITNLGGRLSVSAIDPNVARMLTITGLAHLFRP
ncbi:STAS domain-containing protein [Actinokineospora cianjurensis]|uniref:Anti-sigma factor antagonist n=1 Tax=Actinokineospora cianjurensis TaxID=585224 RepID=A0A421AVK6_9PSEU|nr:STAS domain-containing protein [Actinokineospora cianjurensis]RLK53766.1 anti-sigma B factor antagonist [Actinokineospora cianjurensis]